jgi:hypothetical protein
MPYPTPELSAQEVLEYAQDLLEEKLPLKADGYKCTTDDLFKVLLGVAATKSTLEAVCAELVGTPEPQTIRGYFNDQLCVEDLPTLEAQLNAALAAEVPRHVRRQSQEVAIDYHDRPYYGKGEQARELWVRGKAKDGTTRFYRVATAYLIRNGVRVTLAIHFVLPEDEAVRVVDGLLKRVHAQGIPVSCLLLDKGVESIAMMAYWTRQGQAALSACPIRGTTGAPGPCAKVARVTRPRIRSRTSTDRRLPRLCLSAAFSPQPDGRGVYIARRNGCCSLS